MGDLFDDGGALLVERCVKLFGFADLGVLETQLGLIVGMRAELTDFEISLFEFGFEEAEFLEAGEDFLGAVFGHFFCGIWLYRGLDKTIDTRFLSLSEYLRPLDCWKFHNCRCRVVCWGGEKMRERWTNLGSSLRAILKIVSTVLLEVGPPSGPSPTPHRAPSEL